MATDVDYGPMLADLERRRDEINQAIATIRAVMGLPPGDSNGAAAASVLTKPVGGGAALQKHQFFGMKAPEAVKAYLAAVKEARTAAKIASDLMEYGFTTSSASPANTIRTALVRLEEAGEVVQIKKEWGLAAWFPGLRKKGGKRAAEEKGNGDAKGEAVTAKPAKKGGWRAYYAERRRAGKTMAEAAVEWRKKKAEA